MKQVLKPAVTMLYWLGGLALLALLLGTLQALGIDYPAKIDSLYWGALLALAGLSLLDACWLLRRPSPRIQRELAGSLALDRWNEARLDLQHDGAKPLTLRVFDHLPQGLEHEDLPQTITLPARGKGSIGYRLRPSSRGHFTFEHCEISLPGPLRLWTARRHVALQSTTRVYPDFARLYGGQLLAVDNWLSQLGVRQLQRRGLGMEFNQLREFREGDSLRQIDWKATARQRTPIAREYQDERDQQIVFMLDCGRRMRSQDGDLSHFDHALNACLLLSYVALRQGDSIGLATFAGEQDRYLAPVKGLGQLNLLLNSVYDLQTTRRPADYSAAVRQLMVRHKKRSLVVLITNLRDEDDEELLAAVRQLGKHHRVLIASLREEVLDSLRQSPVQTADEALEYCGAINFLNARASLHDHLRAQGMAIMDARPKELGPQLITRYLSWKKAGTL
ncbi:DUF58 domain-containing protein [Pseudomonas syringae pv. actinidiae]|uniref:DUF58 domain-containing protein n=7 Tax=Pseudomonas syringae group TaxID=136849 RepID=A0A0K8M4T0_PSESF|nr:DUF58 domain-containing protein [Pseudomonas syringae]EPN70722.1 hypothetical protein A234_22968 [Pseudomonas syringae pv. actinidiae ICMP 19101]OZI87474.1 DUF58 domain-containing protein [Pseudomonas avellanae]AKT32130.1 membrane protein [Pseudomonas syringae pv. actinidiae ICMP 18884]AOE58475.1 hypothetical protein NZ708_21905 [Pseudomonas syringae pv. actinidiae ICMP 18708]APP99430.1 hypothetical protein PsaNZ45_22455 [Pseudomonas syringae pv. actinidiae]